MKDKIYPAIYANGVGCTILWFNENKGISLDDGGHVCKESTSKVKNITHEYLQNTYGEVVSPEHAEFIIELAKVGGIDFVASKKGISKFKYFRINESYLGFYTEPRNAKSQGIKQITIPLPPKQIQTATPEEEFEMTQIMKNAGDNLILGCESQLPKSNAKTEMPSTKECKGDEWPKIGDEVLICPSARRLMEIKGKVVKVIGKCAHSDSSTIITVEHSSLGVFAVANGSWIKKPKTPEEELRDDIMQTIHDDVYHGAYGKQSFEVFANALMSKYNITKKPQ